MTYSSHFRSWRFRHPKNYFYHILKKVNIWSEFLFHVFKASDHDDDESEGVIKVLVENGADVHARDIYGLTPLHYAAMRGHDVAARDLLEFGHVDTEVFEFYFVLVKIIE